MKIKEAVYKTVQRECREMVEPEVYGCDCCKKPLNMGLSGKHRAHLEATVFRNNEEAEDLHFCSWVCVLKKLPKVKTDYFISLPYLTYDGPEEKGMRAKDFFKAVKQFAAGERSE